MAGKVNLESIPADWIEIDQDGKIIIKNKEFAKKVEKSLHESPDADLRHNGGCSCSSGGGNVNE